MADGVAGPPDAIDGLTLREMFAAGTAWLESQAEAVNALNVFPVPDGDTGTNMLLTMRDAVEASRLAETASTASATVDALARGALLGARGNSGVILSQILRGFCRSFEGKERIGGQELAAAFQEASAAAYKAVANPVEGTILTVIREVAEATEGMAGGGTSLASVFETACSTARWSVARTTQMLDVLREHGVVDAGGQGLAVLLDGMARHLKGEVAPPAPATAKPKPAPRSAKPPVAAQVGRSYGFCTQFFVEECSIGTEELRARFEAMAESVVVAGEEGLAKVHLHTFQPDPVLAFAGSVGKVGRVTIEDIDEQHQEFIASHAGVALSEAGVVAVVAGDGLASLFRSLGAAAIVPGGQTMNPSAEEILEAALGVPAEQVIILPNNRNVVPAAGQAKELAPGKQLHVVPTQDMPQGVSAMMAFNYEVDAQSNVSAMEEARATVKTGEVTRAVREAAISGVSIAKGQAIGLTGGALVVAEVDAEAAVERLAAHIGVEAGVVVTLYYGAEVAPTQAQEAQRRIQRRFPSSEVQAFYGGQPHYHYLLSVE